VLQTKLHGTQCNKLMTVKLSEQRLQCHGKTAEQLAKLRVWDKDPEKYP